MALLGGWFNFNRTKVECKWTWVQRKDKHEMTLIELK